MSNVDDLVRQAEQLAKTAPTWADLFNALYDPIEGILARAYPTREERYAFIKTEEYRRIQQLLGDAMERHGLIEGGIPQKITEFMVQFQMTLAPDAGDGSLVSFVLPRGSR